MANSALLLDTSVVIRHFRRAPSVTAQMDAAEALFLPAVVLGELYYGAFHGRQREKELRWIETTAISTEVSIRQLQEVHARCHPAARLPENGQSSGFST